MKSKSFEVAQVLFTKAGHDLQAAELLMAEGATDVICFHLQQSVEKLLKAYLQGCEVAFPHSDVIKLPVHLLGMNGGFNDGCR